MKEIHWFTKLDSSEVEKEDFRIGLIQELSDVIEDLLLFCISGWPLAELVLSSGWLPSEWQNSYCHWPKLCPHLLQQPGENDRAHLEKQRKRFPRSPSTSPLIPYQSEIDCAPILHSVNPLGQDKCGPDWFRSRWQVGWDYLDCVIRVHTGAGEGVNPLYSSQLLPSRGLAAGCWINNHSGAMAYSFLYL